MNKVNVDQKLSLITGYWDPKIVGELNGQYAGVVNSVCMEKVLV